jgi:hypothetical protein
VDAARANGAALEVIDVPDGQHGFDSPRLHRKAPSGSGAGHDLGRGSTPRQVNVGAGGQPAPIPEKWLEDEQSLLAIAPAVALPRSQPHTIARRWRPIIQPQLRARMVTWNCRAGGAWLVCKSPRT